MGGLSLGWIFQAWQWWGFGAVIGGGISIGIIRRITKRINRKVENITRKHYNRMGLGKNGDRR